MSVAPDPAQLEALGEDLCRLLDEVGGRLTQVSRLTTLGSERLDRGSFRLAFEDGRLLKGQRLETVEAAARVGALYPLLDRRYFPALLGKQGRALLFEWAPGRPLGEAAGDLETFERAGAILGAVHRLEPPAGLLSRHGTTAGAWRRRLKRNLDSLVELEALDRARAERALGLAQQAAPSSLEPCVIHGDFCAENLVLSGARLSVVDNETLSIDALAYDLCRVQYRWPMDPEQQAHFERGYRRKRTIEGGLFDDRHWMIAVLSEAAVFRIRGGTTDARLPLERLEQLLERHG